MGFNEASFYRILGTAVGRAGTKAEVDEGRAKDVVCIARAAGRSQHPGKFRKIKHRSW
jgi:hypothetical protein